MSFEMERGKQLEHQYVTFDVRFSGFPVTAQALMSYPLNYFA